MLQNCDSRAADGASVALDPQAGALWHGVFNTAAGRCQQSSAATATDRQCGSAVMTGVPVGQVTPRLKPPGKPTLTLRPFEVRAGELYQVILAP